ncbi:gamma-butyrobetaine hydroxylase-like domain-containing protein [Arenimonas oryziterrae]|uniref:Gamma-butyrobetaine hydroxylase-like N-terminal domain-containing protein n=1 Tax=Arenimonas oryziterrae DSM 21050 = YC6267 TaxID=1121015 RepID=A0A091AZI2_9GAMM|nr:DUF971 domain-containing protein [Arenimonas oryziterrae]KFN44034.1 hypothetical protein N789_06365 [Arenimonas oryziterrae DSM 21050 = YC6267]
MSNPRPIDIIHHRASHALEVAFDNGERYTLPCEYLRVESPSAEVQGHGPGQRVLVPGKRNVNIAKIEPIGNYAVALHFDDGHASGIYSWTTLRELGQEYDVRWPAYLAELQARGLDRDR